VLEIKEHLQPLLYGLAGASPVYPRDESDAASIVLV
jgi:hypothetical protein